MSFKQFQWDNCVPFFLVAMLFFIPISSTFKSVFLVLSAVGFLLTPSYWQDFPFVFSNKWSIAAITFFVIVLVACLWSAADYHTCAVFIKKYSKFIYLPIMAVGFRSKKNRILGIYAFILAMLLTCVMSFVWSLTLPKGSFDPGEVFHNHIVTSFMMAFAAYLTAILTIHQDGLRRIALVLLTLLFSYHVLFVNTGRTGYVIYFVLMIMFLIQNLPLKHIAVGILCFCALFAFFSYQSNVLSLGFHQVVDDLGQYQQGHKKTSVGYRLMFHQYAKSLFISSPWIGHGTGGFSQAFQQDKILPEWNNLLDPHSQYWLVAAEQGLLGLMALFAFFISLWMAALRLGDMKPVMLGMLVAIFLGNVSDSLLLYSVIGNLFIVFSALCMGELVEKHTTGVTKIYLGDYADKTT